MSLISPPQPSQASPDAGLIDDARRRQRRRRARSALLLCLAAIAALAYVGSGGSGGGANGGTHTATGDRWPRASVGHGISVTYPPGWHLFAPPITSLQYPQDRLLLTSYAARPGGDCSPTRAERALPTNGVLIWLTEYGATSGTVFTRPQGSEFPTRVRQFALSPRALALYECWLMPAYLERFQAAGRLFQAQIAVGAHVNPARRAEAIRVLDNLRIQALTAH